MDVELLILLPYLVVGHFADEEASMFRGADGAGASNSDSDVVESGVTGVVKSKDSK